MRVSTQCFIKNDGKILMLHRNKKKNDFNEGKWIGIGGKLEYGESPEEALVREVQEETGLTLKDFRMIGIVTYAPDEAANYEGEVTFFYTSDAFEGSLIECNEGDLEWVEEFEITDLNLWESDYELFKWIRAGKLFSGKVTTDNSILKDIEVKFY